MTRAELNLALPGCQNSTDWAADKQQKSISHRLEAKVQGHGAGRAGVRKGLLVHGVPSLRHVLTWRKGQDPSLGFLS